MPRELKELFCEKSGCPERDYRDRALHECLYPAAKEFSPWLRGLAPRFFDEDLDFIERLGRSQTLVSAQSRIEDYRNQTLANRSLFRSWLRFRVSSRQTEKLVRALFGEGQTS